MNCTNHHPACEHVAELIAASIDAAEALDVIKNIAPIIQEGRDAALHKVKRVYAAVEALGVDVVTGKPTLTGRPS